MSNVPSNPTPFSDPDPNPAPNPLAPDSTPRTDGLVEPVFPPAFVRDLRSLYDGRVVVPPAVDAAILENARRSFELARRRRLRIVIVRTASGLAAAAVLGLAVLLAWPTRPAAPVIGSDVALLKDTKPGNDKLESRSQIEQLAFRKSADTKESDESLNRFNLKSKSDRPAAPSADADSAGRPLASGAPPEAPPAGFGAPPSPRGEGGPGGTGGADPTGGVAMLAGDLNGDGKLDILDALLLAREIKANQIQEHLAEKAFVALRDLNGDGAIDQRDVDAIAQLAVSLTRTTVAKGPANPAPPAAPASPSRPTTAKTGSVYASKHRDGGAS